MSDLVCTVLATVGTVLFGSMQNILVPILVDSFKDNMGSPYFILITSTFFFWVIFGIIFAVYKYKIILKPYPANAHLIFFLTGLFDAFTGIFIVYASDAVRTPIVLQSVLAGTAIIFTLLASKLLIASKKNINYHNRYVYLAMFLLTASVLISTIPQYIISKWGPQNIFWIFVFLFGIICRALYNTLQEKYIEMAREKEMIEFNPMPRDWEYKIVVLYWTCFYQFIVMVAFVWLDIIPFFGYSTPSNFLDHTKNFYECYFGFNCKWTILLGLGFVFGYVGSYFSAIYLNAKSANFSMLATTMIPPTVIGFFEIFPSLNSGEEYPLAITIVCILLNTACVVIWRYWEHLEERKVTFSDGYSYLNEFSIDY